MACISIGIRSGVGRGEREPFNSFASCHKVNAMHNYGDNE